MSLIQINKWRRNDDATATERFRCEVIDANGTVRLVRLSRTRQSTRKATYGWRLLVDGFGNRHTGYYGDNESGAKKSADDMLKRMIVKINPAPDPQ